MKTEVYKLHRKTEKNKKALIQDRDSRIYESFTFFNEINKSSLKSLIYQVGTWAPSHFLKQIIGWFKYKQFFSFLKKNLVSTYIEISIRKHLILKITIGVIHF